MIFGPRYTCLRCPDYDLFFKCYPRARFHGPDHPFEERWVGDDEEASEAGTGRTFLRFAEETEGSEGSQGRGQLSSVSNDSDDQSSGSSV